MDDPVTLQVLLDSTQDTLVLVDESGTCRYANDAVRRRLGYAREDFVGADFFAHVHPEDVERVRETFEAVVSAAEERTARVEYRYRRADGSWVWFVSRLSNRGVDALDGYVVSSRDVTDRRRAQERHRESERRLRQLTTNACDILWMFSADWEELLFVNDAFEEVWGMSTDEVEADPRSFVDGVHPDDRDRVREAMTRLSDGEPIDLEFRVNPTLDYRRWVWVQGAPIHEDGEVTRVAGFSRDVTDRRRRQRQFRIMDNLLRHNLRNDMNVVLGHAQYCLESLDPSIDEHASKILETGRKLLETAEKEREIVDVLAAANERERVDLTSAVGRVLEGFRESYPEASVEADLPASAPALTFPEVACAIRELLENAVDHAGTETSPEVELDLRVLDDVVELAVRDNAPPIPQNEVGPLFEETPETPVYHRTGLGLWLVYWVVDLSDGDIEFRRREDGNVVTVSLPRADDAARGDLDR